ncbi:MAG: hypothetical protein JWP81_4158 [Ferruginibacter sp.]|nr:hypothetical protein [Ferruginibacter sp.]
MFLKLIVVEARFQPEPIESKLEWVKNKSFPDFSNKAIEADRFFGG